MKLQKLVYFAHGWHLALMGDPLIDEQVECWRYGPVIPTLYHAFKRFGDRPITERAVSYDDDGNEFVPTMVDAPESIFNHFTSERLVDRVVEVYGKHSAIKLSNMTHKEGGPWDRVMKEWSGSPLRGTDIPHAYMRDYFSGLLEERA